MFLFDILYHHRRRSSSTEAQQQATDSALNLRYPHELYTLLKNTHEFQIQHGRNHEGQQRLRMIAV